MHTLVVSDLHLGARAGRDALREQPALEGLIGALAEVDRLVLLGDIVELRHGPVRDALAVAGPVLEQIGAGLPPTAEVVLVPGNHDHHLLDPWRERSGRADQAPPLTLANEVDFHPGEPLETIASALGADRVRASYPGIWLREDVYATHGHYLDRHTTVPMFERLGAGAMARIVHEPAGGPASPQDYERVLAPIYAWLHAIAQHGGPELGASSHGASARAWQALEGDGRRSLRARGLAVGFPLAVAAINRAGVGPVRSDISGPQLRRAALIAISEVMRRLRVSCEHVIFGHTHRAGPLPGDDPGEWRTTAGSRLLNTGSWVNEPGFIGPRPDRSPYRPGFGVLVRDAGDPVVANLLDPVSSPAPA